MHIPSQTLSPTFSASPQIQQLTSHHPQTIRHLPPIPLFTSQPNILPFPLHPLTTPSINTLNNHGDITHPCLSPTPTLNHSVSSLLALALQFSKNDAIAFNNLPLTPPSLRTSNNFLLKLYHTLFPNPLSIHTLLYLSHAIFHKS